MTSSSGCGEKQIVRLPRGSLLLPRIFAPSALNTSPFTRTGRSGARHERRHAVLRVVALRELEDRALGLLRQPDHGANLQVFGPLHFVEQPRRGDAREVGTRGAIDVERRLGMALEERRGDLEVDLALDRPLDDARLVLAGGEQRDLARLEDRRDAHRHRFLRDELLAEEIRRGIATRHGVEMHEARAAVRAGARLVEADVARLADAEDLEVDAAGALDGRFVAAALLVHLIARNVAARDVDVLARNVHVREEILPHEPVVRVDVVRHHRVVLVEIERHDVGEAQPVLAVQADQLAVHADGRRSGREPQHGGVASGRCFSSMSVAMRAATSRAMSSCSSTTTV